MNASRPKAPMNADPVTIAEAQKAAPIFADYIRDLLLRGHKIEVAVVKALQAAGMYEMVKEKNPEGIDRIVGFFKAEMLRLEQARDEGKKVIRGTVIEEVDEDPEDVATGKAFEGDDALDKYGVKLV
jgi:hypothetical protein